MEVFLARQPIFNIDQNVAAYEILYRSGETNAYDSIDGDLASRNVIYNTFQTFGIETLTNNKPVFINFTEDLINDETATLFPNNLLVVEILENIVPSEELLEKALALKEMGYRIALDDFVYGPEYEDLVNIADIIKIDFLLSDQREIVEMSYKLGQKNIQLLAEKVETREEFEFAKKLGFTLFQGYFFSKPEVLASKKLNPIKTSSLQLVSLTNEEDIDFYKMARLVSTDLALTYNLLKLVNSAAFGFRHRISTVKHALVALGEREIRKWIYLVVVNTMGEDEPDELTRLSHIRAKFAELIALNTKSAKDAEEYFLMGLLSLLDVILKRSLGSILDELKTSDIIKEALLEKKGEMGYIYRMMLAYEKANWDEFFVLVDNMGISRKLVGQAYIDALMWYGQVIREADFRSGNIK